jgi:hypothetical protein
MAYPILLCPIEGCNFSSRQEKKLFKHIDDLHGQEPKSVYVSYILKGVNPTCECGCGNETAWLGWKDGFGRLLRGHNARINTAFSNQDTIKKCVQSRVEGYLNGRHRPWNSGLSASEDARVAASSKKASKTLQERYASGNLKSWQTGLTAECDQRLKSMSETKRTKFAIGSISPWNKGLSKDSSEILCRAAKKISNAYNAREVGKRLPHAEIELRLEALGFELLSSDDYRSRKGSHLSVLCKNCGGIQQRTLYSIESTHKCFVCCPKETTGHLEIVEFIRSLGHDVISNDRNIIQPLELDIVVPSHKLSIEFNGLYWHSEIHRGKNYHVSKTQAAESAGYRLMHVFEDDWRDRRDIIESMIKHRLDHPQKRVGARSCEIVRISSPERVKFFKLSHIDGDAKAASAWGLVHDGELLACLSVRRPGHKKWAKRWEVARFAVRPNISVPGALSRLSAAALKEAHSKGLDGLVSYVDTRYGDGHGYLSSGYTLHSRTGPTFWWTDFNDRFNRFNYRADPTRGMSEAQVAEKAGVYKLWGCDQLVMIL